MRNFRILFLSVVVILFSTYVQAQIYTTNLTEKQDITDFFPYPMEKEIEYYRQPDIDFNRVLEQDKREGNSLYRVSVKVDQDYTIEDGVLAQYGDIMIWQIGFSAPKSRSLNFLLTDLNLPEGSEMYMISKDNKIVHGPVLPEHIYENAYSSDIIEATDVRIVVKTFESSFKNFRIKVAAACQGVIYPSELRVFGQSAACNVDINCPAGANWQLEKDAVANILIGNTHWCTGALVNNQCQNLRAFFLTANHCITGQNVGQFIFRFRYESGNPLCPGQQPAGGNQGNWFTIPGSVLRANNAATDFALLELNGNLHLHPEIAFGGWDRTAQTPANSTYIHHPNGDAKKITFDAGLNVVGANFYEFNLTPGNNGDFGTLEGGSSGCPKFNANRRIIGQQQGGTPQQILCNTPNSQNTDGRFDRSWNGGGTDATRLSNWLGGANPPTITNTIRASHITPFVPNNGVEYVCITNRLFTLNAPVPGTTVTWSVSNPGLFATSGGASTSGTGTNATLRAASSVSSGSAVLTFTMTGQGCGQPINITRQIWVGRPGLPSTLPSGNPALEIGLGSSINIVLNNAPGTSNSVATWGSAGSVTHSGANPNFQMNYQTVNAGSGTFTATTSNVCGTSPTYTGYINVTNGGGGVVNRIQNVPSPTYGSFV